MIKNTGKVSYQYLEEYNINTNQATGRYKLNQSGDPDYVAPEQNLQLCPLSEDVEQNISTLEVIVINKASQFINFANITIKPDNSTAAFNESVGLGPTQSKTHVEQLLGEFLSVDILSTSSSKNEPITIELRWGSETGDLLAKSIDFIAGNYRWIQHNVKINYQPLDLNAKLYVVVKTAEGSVVPTTTSTSTTTTTTTTTTTSTTTEDLSRFLITVVDSSISESIIEQVTLKSDAEVVAIFNPNATNLSEAVRNQMIRGIYTVLVSISGPNGASIEVQGLGDAVSQKYIGQGVYCFENIDGSEGIIVNLTERVSQNQTVYAKLTLDPTVISEERYILPNGKIIEEKQNVIVNFFTDGAATNSTNATIQKLNYQEADGVGLAQLLNRSIFDQDGVILSDKKSYTEYDYTTSNSPIQVKDYHYTLIPGFGYVIIPTTPPTTSSTTTSSTSTSSTTIEPSTSSTTTTSSTTSTTTTTTTTTTLNYTVYNVSGRYDPDDEIHFPPGGTFRYLDKYGEEQVLTLLSTLDSITVEVSSILEATGVEYSEVI